MKTFIFIFATFLLGMMMGHCKRVDEEQEIFQEGFECGYFLGRMEGRRGNND